MAITIMIGPANTIITQQTVVNPQSREKNNQINQEIQRTIQSVSTNENPNENTLLDRGTILDITA